MSDEPKIIRLPKRPKTPAPRADLEQEIDVVKSAIVTLTEEVRNIDKLLKKVIRGLKSERPQD